MKIRKFGKEDAKEVCELIKRNDLEITSKYYSKKIINLWIDQISIENLVKKSMGRKCFIAEIDGKVIGYVSLDKNEIKKLFVNPNFHKRGIGKKLVERVEKNFSGEKMFVKSNIYAKKFYEKCGFVKVMDLFDNCDGEKIKLIWMEKKLK